MWLVHGFFSFLVIANMMYLPQMYLHAEMKNPRLYDQIVIVYKCATQCLLHYILIPNSRLLHDGTCMCIGQLNMQLLKRQTFTQAFPTQGPLYQFTTVISLTISQGDWCTFVKLTVPGRLPNHSTRSHSSLQTKNCLGV